jgi:hypothetical protein
MQATYAAERLERDAAYAQARDARIAACGGRDAGP